MNDSIQLQFYANHLGNIFGEITDDHIRAIVERAKELGLLPTTEQSSEVQPTAPMSFANYPIKDKPAAPADEDATIDWLNALVFSEGGWCIETRDHAREIVAAIYRGEVPGLASPDEHAALEAEVERLRASENAQLAQARETIVALTVEHGKRAEERDAAIARAEESEKYRVLNGQLCDQACTQRDAARAAHAELVNLLPTMKTALDRGFAADVDVYRHDHNDMVDLLCAVEAAITEHQNKDSDK